jgi:endonuclease/exonuclease/phosphatase (EEP) superfamily protein YafD
VAWLVALALGAALVLRLGWYDRAYPLIWISAFTFYLYLPAYACLAWAAWRRRVGLAVLSSTIIAFHLIWIVPDFLPARKYAPVEPIHSAVGEQLPAPVDFRVYFANLESKNRDYAPTFREIEQLEPDIVVLADFQSHWQKAAAESPVMQAFPHHERTHPPGGEVFAAFAHYPLESVKPSNSYLTNLFLPVDCQLPGHRLRLLGIHAPRPINWTWSHFSRYWENLHQEFRDQPDPLVVIGDFNATQYSLAHRLATAGRLRGGHEDRGRGYATTWPDADFWLPPIRIDHVLISPNIECRAIAEAENPGSDHRSLVVDLRIHGSH